MHMCMHGCARLDEGAWQREAALVRGDIGSLVTDMVARACCREQVLSCATSWHRATYTAEVPDKHTAQSFINPLCIRRPSHFQRSLMHSNTFAWFSSGRERVCVGRVTINIKTSRLATTRIGGNMYTGKILGNRQNTVQMLIVSKSYASTY